MFDVRKTAPVVVSVLAAVLLTALAIAATKDRNAATGQAAEPATSGTTGRPARAEPGTAAAAAGESGIATGWPQFRGPQRDGISRERDLLASWPADGPQVVWRSALGQGFSGISADRGRLYTMFGEGKDEYTVALDGKSGEELWRVRTDSNFVNNFGNGPRSTPTVDDGVAYVLGAKSKLYALDAAKGTQIWAKDLAQEYGARIPEWGVSTSPLIEGNLLIVDAGGSAGSSVIALDKQTGKEVWRSQTDLPGYSAPITIEVEGLRQVVAFTGTRAVSLSPKDGSLLWSHPWKTSYDVNAATPVFIAPDKLLIASGYGVGAELLRIEVGEGAASVESVWKSKALKNKFSSSVFHDGFLYGFDETILTCVDAKSGETQWRQRGLGHGSLIYADGRLIVLGDAGTLVLAQATPEGYKESGRIRAFKGKTWTLPTLAGGRLYLRDEKELISMDISK